MKHLLIAALLLASCTPYRIKPFKGHPGALNHADSLAYDQIHLAEALITQARIELSTKNLEVDAPSIRRLQDALNDTKAEYAAYREPIALGAPQTPSRAKLKASLKKLDAAVTQFNKSRKMP